jgi:hypothetical protein
MKRKRTITSLYKWPLIRINLGDLDRKGNIYVPDPFDGIGAISHGVVWVTKAQAKVAQHYGWRRLPKRPGDGDELVRVMR